MTKRRKEHVSSDEENAERGDKPSLMGTVFAMLGLGIVLGWASVFAIQTIEGIGVPHRTATNLPFLAFAIGAVWGLAIRYSTGAREVLLLAVAPLLLGAVFWFGGLLVGALLLLFGLSEDAADFAPVIAFALGAALGTAPMLALLRDWLDRRAATSAASKE